VFDLYLFADRPAGCFGKEDFRRVRNFTRDVTSRRRNEPKYDILLPKEILEELQHFPLQFHQLHFAQHTLCSAGYPD
jgi:hypothetical protein